MPKRGETSQSYRYGFNGQEKDDKVYGEGSAYDFGERIYDSRIGKWLSVDPLASRFPNLSPYVYCNNNPVNRFDPNGLTDYEVNGKTKTINDGVNNLKISVNQRQFNKLERKFNRENGGYENYRDKMSVKNGYTTYSTSGGVSRNEQGAYVAGELNMNYHAPGGQSYSDWSNSAQLGVWSEGMPTEAALNGQTYVVPINSSSFVNINDKGLRMQLEKSFKDKYGGLSSFHLKSMDLRIYLLEIASIPFHL